MKYKLYTDEEFIEKAKLIHGNIYDYSKLNYKGSKKEVTIICPIHGEFNIVAARHLIKKGHMLGGCQTCGRQIGIKNQTKTTEQFIKEAIVVHGNRYDYSKVNYINAHTKITVICKEHGEWSLFPINHISGNNCKKCANKSLNYAKTTKEVFIKKANKVHNNKYDYSLVKCRIALDKVKIICPEHGIFEQVIHYHLTGNGCQECGISNSFRKSIWVEKGKNREATFYIIRCWNESEQFFKLGITYRKTGIRYSGKQAMPYNYEIVKEVKSYDLNYIWDLEKRFKRRIKRQSYIPKIKFGGFSTECFK